MTFRIPIWFHARNRTLGFKEFLDRYLDISGDEIYTAPLFVSLLINKVDPFIDSTHVLTHIVSSGPIVSTRTLVYYFLYWIFTGNLVEQQISLNNPHARMSHFEFQLPNNFSKAVGVSIESLLKTFFGVSLNSLPDSQRLSGGYDLPVITSFVELLKKQNFSYDHYTVSEIRKLYSFYLIGTQIRDWFLRSTLVPWTVDFSVVIRNNPPALFVKLPFDEDDLLKYLETAIEEYEFIDQFIEELSRFPENSNLIRRIRHLFKPNPVIDSQKAEKILMKCNPVERMKIIPASVPVLDDQIQYFVQLILKNGLEVALQHLIRKQRECLHQVYSGKHFSSEITLISYESIYNYPPEELIWLTYGDAIHVFAREDLTDQTKNPYNREDLPLWVLQMDKSTSMSYPMFWETILGRKIVLPEHIFPIISPSRRNSF